MKKRLLSIGLAFSLLFSTSAFAASININGAVLNTDVAPVIIEGRTLVPMRAIFEKLGADIEWNDKTRSVTATSDEAVITLTVDNTEVTVNGTLDTLDIPAQIIDGRTMVPVRFVAESLNCVVDWDAATQTVLINSSKNITAEQVEKKSTKYNVLRVIDGDTFAINYLGKEEKVRLIGVDTPESVHPDKSKNTEDGESASNYTKQLIEGKDVELEFDVEERDKYGRLLAYVYIDGYMLNKKLLEEGYAVIATYPPNVKYVEDFKKIAGIEDNVISPTTNTETKQEPVSNIPDTTKQEPNSSSSTTKTESNTIVSTETKSKTIYVTPTGKKYHYNSSCNGGTYTPSTLEKALSRGLTPCKKCVL